MAEPNEPPLGKILLAAAAGGFGGAVVGVVAATTLMGDGDVDERQTRIDVEKSAVEVVEPKVASR